MKEMTVTEGNLNRFKKTLTSVAGENAELHWFHLYTHEGSTLSEWSASFSTELGALRVAWHYRSAGESLTMTKDARGQWLVSRHLP